MQWVTLTSLTLLIASCATDPIPTDQTVVVPTERVYALDHLLKPMAERGLIIVKRDKPRLGVNCTNLLYVDGSKVAEIEPAERIELYLSTTEHIIGVKKPTCGGETIELSVTPSLNEPKTLRVWSDRDGNLQLQRTAF